MACNCPINFAIFMLWDTFLCGIVVAAFVSHSCRSHVEPFSLWPHYKNERMPQESPARVIAARAESCDNSCFICLIFSRFFFFVSSSLLVFRFSLLFANKTQFVLWLESPSPARPVPINSSPSALRIMRNRLQAWGGHTGKWHRWAALIAVETEIKRMREL